MAFKPSRSKKAYRQVLAYLEERLGRHPQFDYEMSDFHPDHTLSLVDGQGQVVGFCSVLPSVREAGRFKPRRGYLRIGILETLEAHRGKGVGSQLLLLCHDLARRGGYKGLRTEVVASAAGFYQKHGWVPDFTVKGLNSRRDLSPPGRAQ